MQVQQKDTNIAEAFEHAWSRSQHTRFELPPLKVNTHPEARERGLHMTAWTVWDAEVRKALDPVRYVPSIFSEAQVWERQSQGNGVEMFWRRSVQRSWLTGEPVSVVEHVLLDSAKKRVVFRGVQEAVGPEGQAVRATVEQPLFYVEHSVVGSDDHPEVRWRIVHLTEQPDVRLIEPLKQGVARGAFPSYLAVYAREFMEQSRPPRSLEKAVEVVAGKVQWEQPFGAHGPQMATLWGDAFAGKHGSLLKFSAGSESPMHTHPHDSWGVVVKGKVQHQYKDQESGAWMGPGSWYFEPAGEPHISRIGAEEESVVLVFNPGFFGFVPWREPVSAGE